MAKVVIDNKELPPINIKGDRPLRLLRFRIMSTSRNTQSQWSTIFQVEPPAYDWFSITSSNGKVSPMNVTFNAFNNALSWGPNTLLAKTVATSSNVTQLQIIDSTGAAVNHNLRINDEVLIQQATIPTYGVVQIARFAPKRDGVFKISATTATNITIDLGPAIEWVVGTLGLPTNTTMSLVTELPTKEVDIYIQFKSGSTVISGYEWSYLGTFNSAGTFAIPTAYFPPDASSPDTIEVAVQRPTDPKKRYNANDERVFSLTNLVISSGVAEITATGHTFQPGETVSITSNYAGLSGKYVVNTIATNKFYVSTSLPNQTSTAITGTAVVAKCPVLLCKMSTKYKQTITRTGA